MCKLEKDESEFGNHKNGRDGLRSRCKPCNRIEANRSYKKNPGPTKARARKFGKATQERLKAWLNGVKHRLGCCLCGEKEAAVLDFHHVNPSEKEKAIGHMIAKGIGPLETELSKCVVVCANCHRKVHAGLVSVENEPRCIENVPRSPNRRINHGHKQTAAGEPSL